MIVIVDYGLGNLGSIQNMLRRLGHAATITAEPAVVEQATRLILPGIGAFDEGMANLRNTGLIPLLNHKARDEKIPILGICLGMQLLTRRSEEGEAREPGLAWIAANTVKFSFDVTRELRVPHMGWNRAEFVRPSPLGEQLSAGDTRFYFVHSYHVVCENPEDRLISATYGYRFDAGVRCGNIFGVQFHPEKSHKFGMRLLRNFVEQVR